MKPLPTCQECLSVIEDARSNRRFCSTKCRGRWWKKNPSKGVTEHSCRQCGIIFPISTSQHNKWLCSEVCRKKSNAASVRNFHLRKPLMNGVYRDRSRQKQSPDNQNIRFYKINPSAPRACEACGEDRVTEISHRPGHERKGERRKSTNMKWPEMVWILCPTCHRLLDRMGYDPKELGLY